MMAAQQSFPRRLDQLAALPDDGTAGAALLRAAVQAGLPTVRNENWKYASLRGLDRQVFSPLQALPQSAVAAAAALLPAPLEGFPRIVFVDGLHCPALSDTAPAGLTRLLSGAELAATGAPVALPLVGKATPHSGDAAVPIDLRWAQLNAALAPEALRIALPQNARAALEVVFVAVTEATQAASHPALRVELGAGAELDLVERHLGAAEVATFSNADVRVSLARDASLHHHRLQQLGPLARHFETLTVDAGEHARCELLSMATGAQASRCTALLQLAGTGAHLDWNAVALADRNQVCDNYVRVEHQGRDTGTRQVFRGIAAGRSRIAFNGHMVVGQGAAGAASEQSLKALLAGAGAEADLRPQLEIHIDEVRASHGATVGKLDEQMLFYLRSRGIGLAAAEALLKWAFVADVMTRIRVPALRRQAEDVMAAQLRSIADPGEAR